MKRFAPIFMLLLFVSGVFYYSHIIEEQKNAARRAIPIRAELTMYSDLPQNVTAILAKAYEDKYHVRINRLPLTEEQMAEKVTFPYKASVSAKGTEESAKAAKNAELKGEEEKKTKGVSPSISGSSTTQKGDEMEGVDLLLTSQDNLALAARQGYLRPYVTEGVDLVADQFKDIDSLWVGLWYDPVVFVYNEKFFLRQGREIQTWQKLIEPNQGFGLVMTDFVAARGAANIFYNFVEGYGVDEAISMFSKLKPYVVQYAKFLATPVRLVAVGSADMAIANYSDAAQSIADKYPIKIAFPRDGSPYYLMGIGIIKDTKKETEVNHFIDWLMSKEAKEVLDKEKIYFAYTNPSLEKVKDTFGYEAKVLPIKGSYTEEGKKDLLHRWIEQVRFGKDKR